MTRPTVLHTAVDLATETTAQRFDGDRHDVDVSFFVNHTEPGRTVEQHRHPYAEVFVVQDGEATFLVDGTATVVAGGHVVVVPAGSWHGFTNTGSRPLEMLSLHPVAAMATEWGG